MALSLQPVEGTCISTHINAQCGKRLEKSQIRRLKSLKLLHKHSKLLQRYNLKDGPTTNEMMRKFGLGITNTDLRKILVGDLSNLVFTPVPPEIWLPSILSPAFLRIVNA